MILQGRPLLGALALAGFITICAGWLFQGAGKGFPWWGYGLLFVAVALLIYALARLLRANGSRGPMRSFDALDETE